MKWTKEKMDIYLAMKAEGASTDEIAEMLGCSRQSIYDKTKHLKKAGGAIMSERKCTPAPETVQSGTYETANAILEKERADKLTDGITDSAKRECDAAYERYKNEVAMNDADNELADSPNDIEVSENGTEDFKNKIEDSDNKRLKRTEESGRADIERAMCDARKTEAEAGMKQLTQIGIELAAKSGFIADSMTINIGGAHERICLSGKNARGDYFHLELSRADASALDSVRTGI